MASQPAVPESIVLSQFAGVRNTTSRERLTPADLLGLPGFAERSAAKLADACCIASAICPGDRKFGVPPPKCSCSIT